MNRWYSGKVADYFVEDDEYEVAYDDGDVNTEALDEDDCWDTEATAKTHELNSKLLEVAKGQTGPLSAKEWHAQLTERLDIGGKEWTEKEVKSTLERFTHLSWAKAGKKYQVAYGDGDVNTAALDEADCWETEEQLSDVFAELENRNVSVPHQDNEYDGGLYMLKFIELFATHTAELAPPLESVKRPNWKAYLQLRFGPRAIAKMRTDMEREIREAGDKQQAMKAEKAQTTS